MQLARTFFARRSRVEARHRRRLWRDVIRASLHHSVRRDAGGMPSRAVFPLRWRNERLRALTAEVASRLGISQNELIVQAIEHEVVAKGGMLSEDLRAAADRLAELTSEQRERI